MAVIGNQWNACVSAHPERLHGGDFPEHRVRQRVVNHEWRRGDDRVMTEGAPFELPNGRQRLAEPETALVKIPAPIDERDKGRGDPDQFRGQPGESVEALFGWRIEEARLQNSLEPLPIGDNRLRIESRR